MKSNYKSSVASRATVRSLVVAFMPAAAVGLVASSPAVVAEFGESANHGLTVDDNAATTNGPSTNGTGVFTNINSQKAVAGIRG